MAIINMGSESAHVLSCSGCFAFWRSKFTQWRLSVFRDTNTIGVSVQNVVSLCVACIGSRCLALDAQARQMPEMPDEYDDSGHQCRHKWVARCNSKLFGHLIRRCYFKAVPS